MNTKKSKHKPKQNKPTPQPKSEVETKSEEAEAQIKVKVAEKTETPKSEDVIPVVSEPVLPVLDAKVSEGDTPKKPKRNRGKKKKSDKDEDFDESQEEKPLELSPDLVKFQTEMQESQPVDIGEECADATEVAPAARKKKNKNKKQPEATREQVEQELKITPIKQEDLVDVKIVTLGPVATETDESKSKKKNKKKKRTDSEKSDKADEVLSCTSAFQKLLDNSDKKDAKIEPVVEEIKPALESAKENIVTEKVKTMEQDNVESINVTEDKSSEVKDDSKEENAKGKKKNKKDKKNPPKLESEKDISKCTDIKETITEAKDVDVNTKTLEAVIVENAPISNISSENTGKVIESLPVITDTTEIVKEKSPKPKAKIAKPVDKKRKGKGDFSSTENLIEDLPKILEEKPSSTESKMDVEFKDDIKPIGVIEAKKEEKQIVMEVLDVKVTEVNIEPVETLTDLPEPKEKETPESGPSKKGKKTKHKQMELQAQKDTTPITMAFENEPKTIDVDTEIKKEVFAKSVIDEPTSKFQDAIEKKIKALDIAGKEKDKNIPVVIPLGFTELPAQTSETRVLETPDLSLIEEPLILAPEDPKSSLHVPDANISKKRKKSPKRSKTEAKSTDRELLDQASNLTENIMKFVEGDIKAEKVPKPEKVTKEIRTEIKEQSESIPEQQLIEDIEIRSVKTEESEGSASDIVPDITFPRASSQLLDDNNNTVIRDITATETKLNIPIVIPETSFSQSGNTPLSPPELIPLDISFIEKLTTPKEETDVIPTFSKENIVKSNEKTDLKSKVLDVNQGMEELRKSIERSLAELSAIEKNEKDAEEHFAKAQSKLEQIQELAAKKTEAKAISQAEIVRKSVEKGIEVIDPVLPPKQDIKIEGTVMKSMKTEPEKKEEDKPIIPIPPPPPPPPARKDNKGKGKKKKGKQDVEPAATTATATTSAPTESSTSETTSSQTQESQDSKKEEKTKQKTESQEKGKQQSDTVGDDTGSSVRPVQQDFMQAEFESIENFDDALTSSADDVNKTFEIIANEANKSDQTNPEINVTAPIEDDDKDETKQHKENPVTQPKNLLGHPDIPARLNKTDYKKEKNKIPNNRQAKVKIKDSVPVEVTKESKESQTESKRRFLKDKTVTESIASVVNNNEEYIYKYSFRKVFLPSACHVCKKDLKQNRVPCAFCNLVFYCSTKHKDEDYSQHQSLCFAVSTIVHLKDQKHIYADAKSTRGQDYRLLRMQMIMSCEKVLKRRLLPWEQEALLYPRMCADVDCREWQQAKLTDCAGCGQIAYCTDNPGHLPKTHQRWCKSYSLYHRLVVHQQTQGRLEPKLPSRVMAELYQIPEKLNEVLASMYEEKIDMSDIQYATLTQIATAPLTAAYCQQLYITKMNTIYANGTHKKSAFTIHVVGAELQFEADALNKWEVFFLHLRPDVKDLRVVLIGPDLNPSKLPVELLGKIKLCENCRQNKRRVIFEFQDNKTYQEYWSTDFTTPDLVCAFNPSIQRSAVLNGKDTWPSTIKCVMKLRVPFIITSYTMSEIIRDLARVKQCSDIDVNVISEPKYNAFASVRPDRNFISDDEMPLLFKNFCFSVVCGSF